jgi:hypothetical protein
MKRVSAVIVLWLTICAFAFAQRARSEWDHNTDFAALHTYAWQASPDPAKGAWNQAILDAIDKQLEAKGLTKVDANPDVDVVYSRSIRKDTVSLGGGGYVFSTVGYGGGSPGVPAIPTTWKEGTLVVELNDPKTKHVVWRGSVSKTISDNDSKNLKSLDKAIAKLFRKYPPKNDKK